MRTRFGLLVVSIFVIALSLIGCGGGGGGSNPVAPVITSATASLSGSVLMDGKPMANASVYLYKSSAARNAGVAKLASVKASLKASSLAQTLGTDGSYFTTSDLTGHYSFNNIPIGEYTLIALKDENHQFARPNILLGSTATVDAQLTPTGTITGNVKMNGSGVVGAMVYLEGTSYVALTDGSGTFTISHVPASQTFSLSIKSSKGEPSASTTVELAPAQNKNLGDITLTANPSAVTLTGQLQWSDTSITESFEGFMIGLLNNQTKELSFTMPDASGTFGFIIVASDTYTVGPMGRIHDERSYNNTPDRQTVTVDLSSSVVLPLPFKMSSIGSNNNKNNVWGSIDKDPRLLDEGDNSGVPVTIVPTGTSSGPQMTVVTDSDGGFNFDVANGEYNLVIGGRYTFANTFTNPVSISADKDLGSIKIKPAVDSAPTYIVSGVVNKTVKLSNELDNSGVIVTLTPTPTSTSGHSLSTVTRADGKFFFEVASGTYTINITGNYEPIAALPNPVVVNYDIELANISVAPNSTTAGSVKWTLSGIPTTESYRVYLTNQGTYEEMYKGTSLGNNRVIFNNVFSGNYTLSVKPIDNGYSAQTAQFIVKAGENVVMSPLTPVIVAPEITNATVTSFLEINGNRLASSPIAFVDGSRLEPVNTGSWNANHIEFKAINLRPGTYTLSLENSDGTISVNEKSLFIPLKKPTITSLNFTDTSVKAIWNLGNFADKSRVEIYDNAMAPVGASPWNIQQTTFEYKQLSANSTYTIRIRNGFGDIASNYAEQSFHTKAAGANASVLPKTILAGSSFIDDSNVRPFGFEVINDTYYVAWFDNSGGGAVGINSYDMSGNEVASISYISDYNGSLNEFDFTSDGTNLYMFYRDGSFNHVIKSFDKDLNNINTIHFNSAALPPISRGKIKAFGSQVLFCGEYNTGNGYKSYTFGMGNVLTAGSVATITYKMTNYTYKFKDFTTMVTANVPNNKLYIAIATGSSSIDSIVIDTYNLTDYSPTGASQLVISSQGLIRQFLKTSDGFLIGIEVGSGQEYAKINGSNGYATMGKAQERTSAGIDAQGRIWYNDRPGGSGAAALVKTSDGFHEDLSIRIFDSATVDAVSSLCIPGEFIKLQKSNNQMNMLHRDSSGDLAVYHYDSSY